MGASRVRPHTPDAMRVSALGMMRSPIRASDPAARNNRGRSKKSTDVLIATPFAFDEKPASVTCCRQRKSCASRSIFTGQTAVHEPHSVDANGSVA